MGTLQCPRQWGRKPTVERCERRRAWSPPFARKQCLSSGNLATRASFCTILASYSAWLSRQVPLSLSIGSHSTLALLASKPGCRVPGAMRLLGCLLAGLVARSAAMIQIDPASQHFVQEDGRVVSVYLKRAAACGMCSALRPLLVTESGTE